MNDIRIFYRNGKKVLKMYIVSNKVLKRKEMNVKRADWQRAGEVEDLKIKICQITLLYLVHLVLFEKA